jgi:hypothetical protein
MPQMAQMANSTPLSRGDERILDQVFDPESSPEAVVVPIDASLPADPHINHGDLLRQLRNREMEAIRLVEGSSQKPQLSSMAMSSSEQLNQIKDSVYNEALQILSTLIAQHPDYASAYNNRAQLRRWRMGDSLSSHVCFGEEIQESLIAVVSDLQEAIRLSSPAGTNTAVSPQQAKLLIQAWTQLGAVFWSLGRRKKGNENLDEEQSNQVATQDCLETHDWLNWDNVRFEEEGSRCFFMAGMYGSDVGRSLAVKTNPYARLCGGIVKEALKREGSI